MNPLRTRLTAFTLVAALVLAACSSGGGGGASVSKEGEPYAAALSRSLTDNEDGIDIEKKQADCVSGHIVNAVGVDQFEAAGVTPDQLERDDGPLADLDLDEKQANEFYDSFKKCDVDLRAMMLEDLADDDDMSDAAKKCIDEAITDDLLRTFVVAEMRGDDAEDSPEAMAAFGALMGCAMMDMGEMDFDFDDEDFDFNFDEEFDSSGR